jgi:hypothetical protein
VLDDGRRPGHARESTSRDLFRDKAHKGR